jgi:hypothetical protein
MTTILRIGTDPTSWVVSDSTPDPAWTQSAEPVAIPVSGPIAGRLLLAPRRAATLALTVPGGSGWVPCEKLTAAYLYVPSATGWNVTATGYALAEGTDLGELEAALLAAMSTSATVTVSLATIAGPGVMVVNGGMLAFAVVAPAGP